MDGGNWEGWVNGGNWEGWVHEEMEHLELVQPTMRSNAQPMQERIQDFKRGWGVGIMAWDKLDGKINILVSVIFPSR